MQSLFVSTFSAENYACQETNLVLRDLSIIFELVTDRGGWGALVVVSKGDF